MSPPPTSKRLHILTDEEIAALYACPQFTLEDRERYFTLTPAEQVQLQTFAEVHAQCSFLLQLAYFKAKHRFFRFALAEVADDITYVHARFFPHSARSELKLVSKPTLLKQQELILSLCQYRRCTAADRHHLAQDAATTARISAKPIYLLRTTLQRLEEQRLVAPGYTVLQDLIGHAITAEEQRLGALLAHHLTSAEHALVDQLVTETTGLYPVTLFKKAPKDFSLGEMRRELTRGETLRPLYDLAARVLPLLAISNEGINYYASLVGYYSVFRLNQLDPWTQRLYLLCFVFHRYHQWHDHLLTCFLAVVRTTIEDAKAAAKQQIYDLRVASNQDLPQAGLVLKLLATQPPETPFSQVQAAAFALLERARLEQVADYLVHDAAFDERALQWAQIETHAQRFKLHLRPLLRAVTLAATPSQARLLAAVQLLQTTFAAGQSLRQVAEESIPTDWITARDKRYLYGHDEQGEKRLRVDRYEFFIYRLVRARLEAGDLFCRASVRFRSFEDDLIDDVQWQDKTTLIAQTGCPILQQPIHGHLADLEQALEARILQVNERIAAGDNPYFQQKGKGKRWTLQYPKGAEPINHPLFDTLRHINVGSLLHFVDQQCGFLAAFNHLLGRYTKQAADDRAIIACLIAWGTNMGLGRMGDISDLSFATLSQCSDHFLRSETLKAANDAISNATAALPIFRHYDLGAVVHSSSDGQKFETSQPVFNARESPKYFGLHKGVVAYSLVANHVPINARVIGAHEHESHYVFDLLFNNTTTIQPAVHSTDTHGTNQVNFALLHVFGYQFAPRYRAIQEKVRTGLYGFKHPTQYGDLILKPIRKLNTALIAAEWPNLQRIFVSLARKTTTQSIIVSKLSAYARKNSTRQACWEYDNVIQSGYLLDFVDSAPLRQNVQRALNRGENYHQLRRAVSYANFGKLRFRTEEEQQLWSECSRLITNAIIFYNATLLSQVLARKEAAGDQAGIERILRVSPVAWQHINFYGRYEFVQRPEIINLAALVEVLAHHPLTPVEDDW